MIIQNNQPTRRTRVEERDKQLLKMIRKQSEDMMQDVSTDVEREFSRKHNERIVHEVIKEMEEPDRTIFILRFFYYETVKVIAETVHLKEDNVESRIRRGKKKLKAELLRRGVLNE